MKNRSFTFLSPALYCAMSLFASTLVHANNLPPVAVIDLTPDKAVYYHGEIIALYGGNSYVQSSGNINYYQWYINGILKMAGPGATSYNHTVVMEPGLAEQTLTIRLRVQHSNGLWGEQTVTRTEKQKPGQHYYLTDHLGSVRATVNEAGTLIGWDDFYPFGMVMPGRSSNTANPNDLYKFTGHERDTEAGLEIDFMNARTYDSEIGRFLQRDPLAAMYPGWSPYTYTFNNPIRYVDLTGLCPEDGSAGWTDEYGERTWCAGSVTKTADRYNDDSEWASSLEVDGWEVSGSRILFDASKPAGAQNLYNHLRETGSACEKVSYAGFSETARKIAMTACIHGGQAAFLTNSLKFSATAVGILALTYTGVGVIAGSYGLIAVGTTFSTGATILNTSASLSEGNIEAALPQLLLGGATRGIYNKIGTTRSLGNITNLERSALTFPVFSSEIIGNFTIMYLTD